MDLSPFKQDVDELINEFAQGGSRALADMKRIWMSRKFSYIYEARPSSNLTFFMQTLYSQSIGHMVNLESLSRRLGGLYCLYCLYETQPFKPPFRIYLSLGELKNLKQLVASAKVEGITVVSPLVKKMLENNMFLFGAVEINEGSITERVNQLMELQNARVQVAYKKLFANTRIEHFLHMDLGTEIDMDMIKNMSNEYAEAKKRAIKEASEVIDVQNIEHIAFDKKPIGDELTKIEDNWTAQRDMLYRQIGFNQHGGEKQQHQQLQLVPHQLEEEPDEAEDVDFEQELEQLLSRP